MPQSNRTDEFYFLVVFESQFQVEIMGVNEGFVRKGIFPGDSDNMVFHSVIICLLQGSYAS